MIVMTIALLVQAATPTPVAAAHPPAAKEKMVCITEAVVGSRLGGHRICRTAAEWERDRREGQDDVERAQRLARLPGQ